MGMKCLACMAILVLLISVTAAAEGQSAYNILDSDIDKYWTSQATVDSRSVFNVEKYGADGNRKHLSFQRKLGKVDKLPKSPGANKWRDPQTD